MTARPANKPRTGAPLPALLLALLVAAAPPARAEDKPSDPARVQVNVDPRRFGQKPEDAAYGAFQRGLYVTALNLALPRARSGDPAAQTLAAEIHMRGFGVRRNEKEAALWYEKAAAQGVAEAQFQLALILYAGESLPRDEARGRSLLKEAAASGHALAAFNYAQDILRQNGSAAAYPYYLQAAKAGLPDAQFAMAQLIGQGQGAPKDTEEMARDWLMRAARQNYDTAQLDLGAWMIEGKGGPADAKAGFGWIYRAALSGNIAARNRLAKLYMAGIGTEPDAVSAGAWTILARRAGLTDPVMSDFMDGLSAETEKKALAKANLLR